MNERSAAAGDGAMAAAWCAHRDGRLGEAEAQYRLILARREDAAAMHFLGALLHQQGDHDAGLKLLWRSLELAPQRADWHNDLGNVLAAAGRDGDAVGAFMRALELEPNDAVVWNNLGAVLRNGGHVVEAVQAFQNAVALEPAFADALHNLGDVLVQLGRIEEAARSHCAAYVLRPGADKPRQMLGIAYYTLGRIAEAAQVYRLWLHEEPHNPVARHLLAACTGEDVPDRASDAYVESQFDGSAATFDRKLVDALSYRIPALAGQVLKDLAVPARSRAVLDAGCGTGLCGPHLAPYARHLVGVDLSGKSLAVATRKSVYDQLVKAELTEFLSCRTQRFDLIVSADTLIYFGRLDRLFAAVAGALTDAGIFVASTEEAAPSPAGYTLNPSGRYGHSREYLTASLRAAGFEIRAIDPVDVRIELGVPVKGLLFVAARR